MIKLKNGFVIEYNKNFDVFFQKIIESILDEAQKHVNSLTVIKNDETENDILLKDIMDNCIYVTHQIFQMSSVNENLAKFLITGCLFNCIALTLKNTRRYSTNNDKTGNSIH